MTLIVLLITLNSFFSEQPGKPSQELDYEAEEHSFILAKRAATMTDEKVSNKC